MSKISRLYNTLIHLRFCQILGQLWYRFGGTNILTLNLTRKLRITCEKRLVLRSFPKKKVEIPYGKFSLLNISHEFANNKINWEIDSYGKLWGYNLNYMEYLLNDKMTLANGEKLILDYIEQHDNNKLGREPYPTSLRLVNWIKFISIHNIQNKKFDIEIYRQTKDLLKRVEFHIQGNHIFENYTALVFSSFYLNDSNLFNFGTKNLEKELKLQILRDGGHFELSPMYHCIILERILDLINLFQNNTIFENQKRFLNILYAYAKSMLLWLKEMSFNNNQITLFNDSAYGISLEPIELLIYAQALGVVKKDFSLKTNEKNLLEGVLGDSGYKRINTNKYQCIIDLGKIGPDYLPAHAHNDIFNFELHGTKGPIIVDPGITNYERGERRILERSTLFHNTVFYEKEQADIWDVFRVGKRPKTVSSIIESRSVDGSFCAQNNKRFKHNRRWTFYDNKIEIRDRVSGVKNAIAHFYFDSNLNIELENNIATFEYGIIKFSGFRQISLGIYQRSLGFNKTENASFLKIEFSGKLYSTITIN